MKLLPQPQKLQETEGKFYTDYHTVIVIQKNCGDNVFLYARMLQETILQWGGVEADVRKGEAGQGNILLTQDPGLSVGRYRLDIAPEGIRVAGSTEEALCNGVQTLRQIYSQSGAVLDAARIEDYPDLPSRGFYHDVSRGRVPRLERLKELADALCYYKLNQLQLYVEHTYLFRGFSEVCRGTTPLTAQEILELKHYCKERHIDLVPSLSTFGHLYRMLRTYTYEQLCELEGCTYRPFSFVELMDHHTVNVSHPETLGVIKGMVKEYMALFDSPYFNICADETFDLCKGKSRFLTQEQDVEDIYTRYLGELCRFVLEQGKTPMFWGDILCGFPEKIKELPDGVVCLNWGYASAQSEDGTRKIFQTGVKQYTCPGAGGWNQWVNTLRSAYENITRMCGYARKYQAIGVLNTDWGDFGHINQPEFSRPGMIYGAAFSWNTEPLDFEETNRRISLLEFHDPSMEFVSILTRLEGNAAFDWECVVRFREMELLGGSEEERKALFLKEPPASAREKNSRLRAARAQLQEKIRALDSVSRSLHQKYLLGIDAMILWNRVKPAVARIVYQTGEEGADDRLLACDLEQWLLKYQREWRKVSKEGDLGQLSELVFWYADLLRKGEARHRCPPEGARQGADPCAHA
ncbi:MAG: beta-N-acetylhexosaminidase [Clostridium sp.]|jgi:hypothetical protein|nr:beta-N-acetylhexosaminidase [Clostridium sp.]